MVKRKGTTKAKVIPADFDKLKAPFLSMFGQTIISMEDIPAKLISNWDQSSLKYVPTLNLPFEEKGTKRIEIAGLNDKRAKIILLSCLMSGKLLPTQVIYAGKIPTCLPKVSHPESWYLCYTQNHWSDEDMLYIENSILRAQVPAYCTARLQPLDLCINIK